MSVRMWAVAVLLMAVVASSNASSISSRLQKRHAELLSSIAREQGGTPLIVPNWGPYDVAEDGTMEGHEIAWIDRVIESQKRGQKASIRFCVFGLKQDRVVGKLMEAFQAGVRVQILLDYANKNGARYKVDERFAAIGMPMFNERKDMSAEALKGSFFAGAKTSNLLHNKMRLFEIDGRTTLLTGSLNPSEEAMSNDESIMTIRSEYVISRYVAFWETLKVSGERKWVNSWDDSQPINVMFSPSANGYDLGARVLDIIDSENEFLFITVFSLNLFSDKVSQRNLLTSLKGAVDRGVEIWIVTDRKQSDGPSGFGDPLDDMIRRLSPNIVMYEVINDVGMFNAMHLKDMIAGISRVRVVTDTTNWSSAAMGSCVSIVKGAVVPKACTGAASTESALYIDGGRMPGGNAYGFRTLKHHLGLLDRYWRQIPIQKTNDPAPWDAWARLEKRFGAKIPFTRTQIFLQAATVPGEFIELRGNALGVTGAGPDIGYPNQLNADTRALKQSYRALSWTEGSAMDWTCDSKSGSQSSYTNNGFGFSPENDAPFPQGGNWWKFLAYVEGKRGDWIEYKLVKTRGVAGDVIEWEADVAQQDLDITPADRDHRAEAPRSSNHLARLGYTTRAIFRRAGDSGARRVAAAGLSERLQNAAA